MDTFSQSNVSQCAIDAGLTAKNAEAQKRRRYAELAETCQFEPNAVKITGVYGPSIRDLVRATHLHQRIGSPLQQGSALAI